MSKETLTIGSGQCGIALLDTYTKQYELTNVQLYNSASDNKGVKGVTLLKTNGSLDGSGRNPRVTLENIIPQNEETVKERVVSGIKMGETKQVVLVSSAGGGTGAILNWWIIQNILLPMKEEYGLKIYSVLIFGFKHEMNPVVSNGAIQISNFYYPLMKEVSVIPFMNDEVYVPGGSKTYEKTNKTICESINKIIDFSYFAGDQKENGFNTLDKNEFFRMTEPDDGFISMAKLEIKDLDEFDGDTGIFDIREAKSLIIMYRTSANRSVDMEVMSRLAELFPYQKRISGESTSRNGKNYVEIIANGIPIPNYFLKMKGALRNAEKLKEKSAKDSKKNKEKIKKITLGKTKKASKKLFDM